METCKRQTKSLKRQSELKFRKKGETVSHLAAGCVGRGETRVSETAGKRSRVETDLCVEIRQDKSWLADPVGECEGVVVWYLYCGWETESESLPLSLSVTRA